MTVLLPDGRMVTSRRAKQLEIVGKARDYGQQVGQQLRQTNPQASTRELLEHEAEHYRQFTPFEFYAHEFNSAPWPDEVWDAYNDALADGLDAVQ